MKKKKRIRGNLTSGKHPENIHIKDKVKAVHEPLYKKSAVERINEIPDYTKSMENNPIERTMMKYYLMTAEQLLVSAKDKANTAIENSIIGLMKIVHAPSDKNFLPTIKYVHDRIGGKPKEYIEHTGPGGGPVQTHIVKEVLDFENMTVEELDAIREIRDREQAIIDAQRKRINNRIKD